MSFGVRVDAGLFFIAIKIFPVLEVNLAYLKYILADHPHSVKKMRNYKN